MHREAIASSQTAFLAMTEHLSENPLWPVSARARARQFSDRLSFDPYILRDIS